MSNLNRARVCVCVCVGVCVTKLRSNCKQRSRWVNLTVFFLWGLTLQRILISKGILDCPSAYLIQPFLDFFFFFLITLFSLSLSLSFFFLEDFIYLFLGRGEGREEERERNINMWLPLVRPLLGTWPGTQACDLTGNLTSHRLVHHRPALNPLSHTGQG